MARLSKFNLAHLPSDLTVYVACYRDLKNSRFLRKQLLDGNTEFEYAFLDARKVLRVAGYPGYC